MIKYRYEKEGNAYVVRRWVTNSTGGQGTKISEHYTKEEAQSEVYRLNGWKKKTVGVPRPS
jgi:hypothetical protein